MQYELKSSQNWEKNEVKFSNFGGQNSVGGTGSGQKSGDGGWLGGQAKFSPLGRDPQSPQEKTLPMLWLPSLASQFF